MSIWKFIGRVFGGLVVAFVGVLVGAIIVKFTGLADPAWKHPIVALGAAAGFPIGFRYYERVILEFFSGLGGIS